MSVERINFDHMKNSSYGYGTNDREYLRALAKNVFDNRILEASPTTKEIIVKGRYNKEVGRLLGTVNGVQPYEDSKVLAYRLDDTIETGDYVEIEGITYYADKLDRSTVGYNRRKIQECNNTLKFKDVNTGVVVEYPCYVQDKTSVYSDGLSISKVSVMADDMIMIIVPANKQTSRIPYGYRLVFNQYAVYRVTRVDILTSAGFASIRAIAELGEVDDDLANNLASQDVGINIVNEEPIDGNDVKIVIDGDTDIVYEQTLRYDMSYILNGVKVDGSAFNISILPVDGDTATRLDIVEQGSDFISVKSIMNDRHGVIIRAELSGSPDIFSELEVTCRGWFG